MLIDGDAAVGGDHDGVAVGLGLGTDFKADDAAGATAIVDYEMLPEGIGQLCRQHTRQDVAGAAGHEGCDKAHWPHGIFCILRKHASHSQAQTQTANYRHCRVHGILLVCFP